MDTHAAPFARATDHVHAPFDPAPARDAPVPPRPSAHPGGSLAHGRDQIDAADGAGGVSRLHADRAAAQAAGRPFHAPPPFRPALTATQAKRPAMRGVLP